MTANVQREDASRNKRGGINDPLAGKTPKQIFEDCVWASNEPTPVKIFLLCICRFFDDDCRSSSMSYAQLERDTGLSERKVKELGKTVRRRWLSVGVGKGLMTANGPQNLYHGIIPADVVEKLRQDRIERARRVVIDRRRVKIVAEREITTMTIAGVHQLHPGGVHNMHPDPEQRWDGVHGLHERGAPHAPLLQGNCNTTASTWSAEGSGPYNAADDDGAARQKAVALNLTEDDYQSFNGHANTFGRARSEIVLRPLIRAETDPVLEGLIRALLRTYNSETARGALDDTFGELQALAAVEARAGSQGKGKGLKSLRPWMEQVLEKKAQRICLAKANREAEARSAAHVHEQRLQRRVVGVNKPPQQRWMYSATIDDLLDEVVAGMEG